jgi:hypothetical protein
MNKFTTTLSKANNAEIVFVQTFSLYENLCGPQKGKFEKQEEQE